MELEEVAAAQPNRFHLWYTLEWPKDNGWRYSSGFISEDMIREHMPAPGEDTMILMCGPPRMILLNFPNLDKLNYSQEGRFVYWVHVYFASTENIPYISGTKGIISLSIEKDISLTIL